MSLKERKTSSLVISLVLLCVLTVGCGSSSNTNTSQMDSAAAESSVNYEKKVEMEDMGGGQEGIPTINTAIEYNRKIIKNGNMDLETESFTETIEGIISYTQELGGYVESQGISGGDFYNPNTHNRYADLTLRIPANQFDAFINNGSQFGNVRYVSTSTEDITSNYLDTEIRLKTLNTRYDRLLELMNESGNLEDLITLEKELAQVTYEIEQLTGTLNQYDSLVNMSTLEVNIQEVRRITEVPVNDTFIDQIINTFKDSVYFLLRLIQNLILVLIACIPYTVFLVPCIVIIFAIKKVIKHRKKSITEQKNQDGEEEN